MEIPPAPEQESKYNLPRKRQEWKERKRGRGFKKILDKSIKQGNK